MAKLPYSGVPLRQLLGEKRRSRKFAGENKRSVAGPETRALLQRGILLQKKGDFARAAECCRAVLARHPDQPDALHLLGTVALSALEIDKAIDLFRRAISQKPADPAMRCNLANALMQKYDIAGAETQLRKALKLDPDFAAAEGFMADCKAMAGDEQEAKRLYENLLARRPDDLKALIGYAHLCVTLGDLEAARSFYRRALAFEPVRAVALAGLAACEKFEANSPEVAEIERYLREPGLTASEYVGLRYAAARIADELGNHDEAFGHYTEAKKLIGETFDIAAHGRLIAALIDTFTPEFFAARQRFGDPSKRPVFIVGMPRSGTTITEQIVSGHPAAAGAGELGEIGRVAAALGFKRDNAAAFLKRVPALSPAETRVMARDYLSVLGRVSDSAARVTDKMPHNFLHLGLIALLFPHARIIHCRRDPLDTCVSCFATELNLPNHSYLRDLDTLGTYYREYSALMEHWRSVLPARICDSDYEDLISDPEAQARKLIEFVGLPWDQACLASHRSTRPVNTASRLQVRQPLYSTSVGRWRRYEKHLGPLRAALTDPRGAAKDVEHGPVS